MASKQTSRVNPERRRERVVDEVQRRKFLTTAGLLLTAVAASGRPTE